MKKIVACLLLAMSIALCPQLAKAEADILGKPFPEFTATDTEGNTFTLSEALKDHEAVFVNLWATWCPPCEREMPDLEEAYKALGDQVAFIALSVEEEDTLEIIEQYRQDHSLTFPMGRDEGLELANYVQGEGIPTTVVVDRFGNAAFCQVGSFVGADEVMRLLEAFLGDNYTETRVLEEIPSVSSTRAFPVSSTAKIDVLNENITEVLYYLKDDPDPQPAYIVTDAVASIELKVPFSFDPAECIAYDFTRFSPLEDTLNPEGTAYLMEVPMPTAESLMYYTYAGVYGDGENAKDYCVYLIPGEEYIDTLADEFRSWGYDVTGWEYGEYDWGEETEANSYLIHVVDQYGDPVPGVAVNFCTDATCTMRMGDEDGTITFEEEPGVYHLQILKVPEGYSFDADYEFYTGEQYSEWRLRIKKD